jgi:hypothetical protein
MMRPVTLVVVKAMNYLFPLAVSVNFPKQKVLSFATLIDNAVAYSPLRVLLSWELPVENVVNLNHVAPSRER